MPGSLFRRRGHAERQPESAWLEAMVLPNGLFILVLSGPGLDEGDLDGLDALREQTGAAGVLLSRRPLMSGQVSS